VDEGTGVGESGEEGWVGVRLCNLAAQSAIAAKRSVQAGGGEGPYGAGVGTVGKTSGYYGVNDFLPGLLANYEMTQRSNPALSKPVNRKSLPRLHY
jgi:hypothetical protein